jgi:hypothetical protein
MAVGSRIAAMTTSVCWVTHAGLFRALLLQAMVLAGGFFSGALLARGLGPAARGDYQVVVLFYIMAAPVLGMGWTLQW